MKINEHTKNAIEWITAGLILTNNKATFFTDDPEIIISMLADRIQFAIDKTTEEKDAEIERLNKALNTSRKESDAARNIIDQMHNRLRDRGLLETEK